MLSIQWTAASAVLWLTLFSVSMAQDDGSGVKIFSLTDDDRLPKDPAGSLLNTAALYAPINKFQIMGSSQSYHLPMSPNIIVCFYVTLNSNDLVENINENEEGKVHFSY